MESPIIKQFEFFGNNKWHNAIGQAFFKHDETPHTTIAILKRMNLLEAYMEIKNVIQRPSLAMVIIADKILHFTMYFQGRASLHTSNLIG